MNELSPFFVNKAREELGEDENKKRQSLALFKTWLEQHPFIKMHEIEENNLLMFLRRHKFVNEKALQSFEDMKIYERKHPEWFKIGENELDEHVKHTHTLIRALKQRDNEGQRIVLVDCRQQQEISNDDYFRHYQNFANAIFLEEETQIAGTICILDCTGVKFSYMKKFSPSTCYNFGLQTKCFPARIKQINLVGVPTFGVLFLKFICSLMSKKLRSRVNVVSTPGELSKVMDTSNLLLDDKSDYNEKNFVPIEESIKRATRMYYKYDIDHEQMKKCRKNKTPTATLPIRAEQELSAESL